MLKNGILEVIVFTVVMADFYKSNKSEPLEAGFKIPNKQDFDLLLEFASPEDGEYLVTDNIEEDGYSEEMKNAIRDINNSCICLAVVENGVVVRYKRVSMDDEIKVAGFKYEKREVK